jgi:hypothetical protein
MKRILEPAGSGLRVLPLVLAATAACGSSASHSTFSSSPDGSVTTADAGDDGSQDDSPSQCFTCGSDAPNSPSSYADFPAAPILDDPSADQDASTGSDAGGSDAGPAPGDAPNVFGPATQGAQSGGPCLVEPEVNSLYPKNWLRPRFAWIPASGENLFELRLHVANQVNDLVVYTAATEWTMPKAMWLSLAAHSNDVPMTVTVRGGAYAASTLAQEALGSSGPLGIAPVAAPGVIVYWSIVPSTWTASLKGFTVGDESVQSVLQPSQVTEYSTTCIGCHNATPDGDYASFTNQNNWQNGFGGVQAGSTGSLPTWLGTAGRAAVESPQLGIQTFSKSHWTTGDRIEISGSDPNDDGSSELVWIDLEATSGTAMGTIARTGDMRYAGAPSWSHDGNTIAYVSTYANKDGRLDDPASYTPKNGGTADADIYLVPYGNKAGGTAQPLAGASTAGAWEYYPSFSPDDQYLLFNKVTSGSMYNNSNTELFVIPAQGGTATRLAANDPPACTGKKSPGVTNSWGRWAPGVGTASGGRSFYWAVFSSTRDSASNPQLYLTAVVVTGTSVATYGSLYLWNQPAAEDNHTPAWDNFQIPPPTVN